MKWNIYCISCMVTRSFKEVSAYGYEESGVKMECQHCGHKVTLLISKEEYQKLAKAGKN